MEVVTMNKTMEVTKNKLILKNSRVDSEVVISVEKRDNGNFRVNYKLSYGDIDLRGNFWREFRGNISDQKFIKGFSTYLLKYHHIFDNKEKEDLCRETLRLLRAAQ